MYRPPFPLVAINQIDVQMTSKTVGSGHASPIPLGPAMCEDGHPYVADPATGRKMCTCNLGLEVTYDPRSLMPDVRKQGMPLSGTVGGPSMGLDASAFYPPLIRGMPTRHDRLPPYLTSGMTGQPLTFDPTLTSHPYGLLYSGIDVNGGPIRKVATRETTGPLKRWLSEHKKNPYPTKAEKIMLAIITRMTLTQVSTWFANARRRLKKENKLYPADRERGEDDDENDDDHYRGSLREGTASQSAGSEKRTPSESDSDDINVDMSDCSDIDDDVSLSSAANEQCHDDLARPPLGVDLSDKGSENDNGQDGCDTSRQGSNDMCQRGHSSAPGSAASSPQVSPSNKPKIWSIFEIINGPSSARDTPAPNSQSHHKSRSLETSTHRLPESSTVSILKTSPSGPFVSTAALLTLPPTSSSSSSLSPATAFRPFSSGIGVPFVPRPRLELTPFVSKSRTPKQQGPVPCDRQTLPPTKQRIDEESLEINSREPALKPSSTVYNHEEAGTRTTLREHINITSTTDTPETDTQDDQLPLSTNRNSVKITQSINILKSNNLSALAHKQTARSSESNIVCTSYTLKSERHKNVDTGDRHSTEGHLSQV